MEKQKLIVYFSSLSVCGGVETFAKIFIKQMHKHYDITFVYCIDKGNSSKEIEEFVPVEKYRGQELFCDIFLSLTSYGIRCDTVTAQVKILMVHANYSSPHLIDYSPDIIGKYDSFVAVSDSSAKGFKERYGIMPDVIYNLVDV